jgi:ribosome-interacting GTPase 1
VPLHLAERYDDDPRRLTYVPMLVLANKCDDETCDEDFYIFCELLEGEWPLIPVSAATGRNLDRMGQAVFDELDLIRIYSKIPGQDPNFEAPFVMERGGTVGEFARKVHQDFYHHLKSARVWGTGVHDGQQVGRDHVLSEGDVVELRI